MVQQTFSAGSMVNVSSLGCISLGGACIFQPGSRLIARDLFVGSATLDVRAHTNTLIHPTHSTHNTFTTPISTPDTSCFSCHTHAVTLCKTSRSPLAFFTYEVNRLFPRRRRHRRNATSAAMSRNAATPNTMPTIAPAERPPPLLG